jgi:DNA polymerase
VKVGAERGRPLDGPGGRRTVLTTHPSALLRLRAHGGYDEAFDALVDDLRLAAG